MDKPKPNKLAQFYSGQIQPNGALSLRRSVQFWSGVDTCPIGGQNTQGRAQLNPERDAVKNNLSLGACPKGLTDVIEF